MTHNKGNAYIITAVAVAAGLLVVSGFYYTSKWKKSSSSEQVLPTPQIEGAMKIEVRTIAIMKTNLGNITLELFPKDAPKTVENFVKLSQSGFYNGVKFHRVIKGFMIQGGDPNSKDSDWSDDGRGGPGYVFSDEINAHKLIRGSLAMANAGPNTNGSQFFIVTAESTPWLDGKHTVFGRVIEGMDIVLKIENVPTEKVRSHPLEDVMITSTEIE